MCTAVLSWLIVATALTPDCSTLPATRATRAEESGMTSHHEPAAVAFVAVPLGDLQGVACRLGLLAGPALQSGHHDVLAGEPQGVLQACRRAGGDVGGQQEVLGFERAGGGPPVEGDGAEESAAHREGRHQSGGERAPLGLGG